MVLPEDEPLANIVAFFAKKGFRLVPHQEQPPEPTPDKWRQMSSVARRDTRKRGFLHWADLRHGTSDRAARWYGRGDSDEVAIRSAHKRWRVEEGD